jgi:tRNA A-37 threonylcarbamoyl transferase component Bud32
MGSVTVQPRYQEMMCRLGLVWAEDFLRLEGVILGGHPDRHVLQLSLGHGDTTVRVFMKKEHRIRWKHCLANWRAGFGWASKSSREAQTLLAASARGIGCPEVIAHGEMGGRAFLLLREETSLADLRAVLQTMGVGQERRELARALGRELARIHAAGFDHPDLYAKHILAGRAEDGWRFCILDWQRSQWQRKVSWARRCRDLAALDATLAVDLANPGDRLTCMRAYHQRAAGFSPAVRDESPATTLPDRRSKPGGAQGVKHLARIIRRLSLRLQQQRRIRELRRPPLPTAQQNLIWLDGEALCATRQFLDELGGAIPDWLRAIPRPQSANRLEEAEVTLGPGRRGILISRRQSRLLSWLLAVGKRRSFPAPEFEQAGLLFRLERHGLVAPRVLAVGHRSPRPWHKESFLLTEPPKVDLALRDFLQSCPVSAQDRRLRRQVLQQAGRLLRQLHEAGYTLGTLNPLAWGLALPAPSKSQVVLTEINGLCRCKDSLEALAKTDLRRLLVGLEDSAHPTTDAMRFFLGYCDVPRLLPEVRRLLRAVLGKGFSSPTRKTPRLREVAA